MSLTEALRTGAPEAFGVLYDEHAGPVYAYCHIMVGDEAADAVRDAFIAVARHPGTAPRDDSALPVWLHALARSECVRRGALVRKPTATPSSDPLRRALARLRPEHREALALSLTLRTGEVARVVGVAADTAETLVEVSRRRLEQAATSLLGEDAPLLSALNDDGLHELVMRGYAPPPRQRERVLFSCAAAERAADGALLFDADGMPVPLDGLFGRAEEPTHPFAQVNEADASASPAAAPRSADGVPVIRIAQVQPKESFLSRRRDGLLEAAGLVACVAAATSALALWPSPHGDGVSNMDGTSVLVHRGPSASRSVQPMAQPPEHAREGTTSKPGVSPTPKRSASHAAPRAGAPVTTAPPVRQVPPPVNNGPVPSRPKPPPTDTPTATPTPTPTPTPTDSPTPGDSPTPDPSSSP